jgi:hypothetical protein
MHHSCCTIARVLQERIVRGVDAHEASFHTDAAPLYARLHICLHFSDALTLPSRVPAGFSLPRDLADGDESSQVSDAQDDDADDCNLEDMSDGASDEGSELAEDEHFEVASPTASTFAYTILELEHDIDRVERCLVSLSGWRECASRILLICASVYRTKSFALSSHLIRFFTPAWSISTAA